MRILYVTGDDCSAMYIEDDYGIERAAEETAAAGGSLILQPDGYYIEMSIKEFGDCDDSFITFVKDKVMDYDQSKHENFFVLAKEGED